VSSKKNTNTRLVIQNKKAFFDYFIDETFQAGISLVGTEVKSLRAGRCNLKESYVIIEGNEAFIAGMHISPYEKGNIFNKDPLRIRKLLMHKREIIKLLYQSAKGGYTLIVLSIYFKGAKVKVLVGLCKGKKLYDKREAEAIKDMKRESDRNSG